MCPPGPWPQSWPRAIASVSATFSRHARAIPVATWATSRAWLSRVRWWSAGKTKTWVLPARRRKADECRMRSRSRSKHVRQGSGSSGTARRPPAAGPGRSRGEDQVLGRLALEAPEGRHLGAGAEAGGGVGMGGAQALAPVSRHGGRPAAAPLGRRDRGRLHGP